MVRLGRILRDHREAGAVNSLIALWGFVDDCTFLTKSGHVGLVYQLRGHDAEGLTHGQRRAIVHQFEATLRLLDEQDRLRQAKLDELRRDVRKGLDSGASESWDAAALKTKARARRVAKSVAA